MTVAEAAAGTEVVVCGEALIDLIQQPDGSYLAVPGGGPKNTVIALARLGVRGALVARIGSDGFGDRIREQLGSAGVDCSLLTETPEPTTLAIASLDERGSATYSFYIDGCADGTWSISALPADLGSAKFCVLAGSLSLPTDSMAAAFDHLISREAHRVVVFDPNIRPALIRDADAVAARFDAWVAASVIVKASAEDVEWRYPGQPLADVANRWLGVGPSLGTLTDGAGGGHAFTLKQSVEEPAPDVLVVDTVGAGDTFTAGMVEWLLRHGVSTPGRIAQLSQDELRAALRAAVSLASDTCTRRGADPPWRKPAS